MSPAVGSWNIKDVTTVRFIASETVALNVFSCDKPTRGRVWTVTGTTETGLCFFPISLLGKRHAWLFSLVSSATQKSLWSWTDSTRHPDRGWIPICISLFHFFILLIYLSSLYPTHPTFFLLLLLLCCLGKQLLVWCRRNKALKMWSEEAGVFPPLGRRMLYLRGSGPWCLHFPMHFFFCGCCSAVCFKKSYRSLSGDLLKCKGVSTGWSQATWQSPLKTTSVVSCVCVSNFFSGISRHKHSHRDTGDLYCFKNCEYFVFLLKPPVV